MPNVTHGRFVVDFDYPNGGYQEFCHNGNQETCMVEPCLSERLDEINTVINEELGEEE